MANRLAIILTAAALGTPSVLAQSVQPYQKLGAVNSASCPAKQCLISYPAVPAGKRLVVASVSAQLGSSVDALTLEGNGISFFLPKLNPSSIYLSTSVTLYYEPGSVPTARIYAGGTTQNTSFVVTITGYLVPAS